MAQLFYVSVVMALLFASCYSSECDCQESLDALERKLTNKMEALDDKMDKQFVKMCEIKNLISEEEKMISKKTFSSCKEIKHKNPKSPSGYYTIDNGKDDLIKVYCNMDELCGYSGGWKRVGFLDMADSEQQCPPGFKLYNVKGKKACGRPTSGGGSCASVQFPSDGLSYTEVCGKVIGYQYRSPAIDKGYLLPDINTHYVDGVSLTHGSPRKHIWTFIATFRQFKTSGYPAHFICPCASGSTVKTGFAGNDVYCESGAPSRVSGDLYVDDPLWDGKGCGPIEQGCCGRPPWFHKVLSKPTTDYIELRVCADQGTSDEDAPVAQYEIYVR